MLKIILQILVIPFYLIKALMVIFVIILYTLFGLVGTNGDELEKNIKEICRNGMSN